jgi:hypothetical protein
VRAQRLIMFHVERFVDTYMYILYYKYNARNAKTHNEIGGGGKISRDVASAAKAGADNKPVIAVLKALRHPKSSAKPSFSAACKAGT